MIQTEKDPVRGVHILLQVVTYLSIIMLLLLENLASYHTVSKHVACSHATSLEGLNVQNFFIQTHFHIQSEFTYYFLNLVIYFIFIEIQFCIMS
jgi:hypothetical protein